MKSNKKKPQPYKLAEEKYILDDFKAGYNDALEDYCNLKEENLKRIYHIHHKSIYGQGYKKALIDIGLLSL